MDGWKCANERSYNWWKMGFIFFKSWNQFMQHLKIALFQINDTFMELYNCCCYHAIITFYCIASIDTIHASKFGLLVFITSFLHVMFSQRNRLLKVFFSDNGSMLLIVHVSINMIFVFSFFKGGFVDDFDERNVYE